MPKSSVSQIREIIGSESVAIVGASASPGKVGRMFMDRYVEAGFKTIHPVNTREKEILGYKAYPSVSEIPGRVDLVHVLSPPKSVVDVLRDSINKGVKGIIITSASLGIEGDENKTQEQDIVRLARENNIRIIGPNCLGIYCPASHLPFPLGPTMDRGSIGIVTQSGSFADLLTKIATQYGIYFSKVISSGNECDLGAVDFLEYLGEDEETKMILAYLEGVKDGSSFIDLARKISKRKPIIVWKCGASKAGAKAAASHTGALAGSHEIWKGALDGAGIIPVNSLEEALDCIYMFDTQPMPRGGRVAVATGPGGPAVGTMDACVEMGLEAAEFAPATKEDIRKIIPPFGSSADNPVDLSVAAIEMPQMYGGVIRHLNQDDGVDMIIVIGMGGEDFCRTILEAAADVHKPIAAAVINPLDKAAQDYRTLLSNGIAVYTDPRRAVNAMAKFFRYARFRETLPKED